MLLTLVWSGVGSAILYKVVDVLVGLRAPVEKEREGLDITDHGERAYTHVRARLEWWRPGTALAVGGPQRKLGPLTFWAACGGARRTTPSSSPIRALTLGTVTARCFRDGTSGRFSALRHASMVNRALTSPHLW